MNAEAIFFFFTVKDFKRYDKKTSKKISDRHFKANAPISRSVSYFSRQLVTFENKFGKALHLNQWGSKA